MLEWLAEGKWVLCDRFYLSSLAYQGDCLTEEELEEMNRPALERLTPDLTLYFRLTPEELRAAITPKTKLLMLSYPNNPTGAIMSREDNEAISG